MLLEEGAAAGAGRGCDGVSELAELDFAAGGGSMTRGSSSDELSSEAPRMNLSFSLASGPAESLGLDEQAWLGPEDVDEGPGGSVPDGGLLA